MNQLPTTDRTVVIIESPFASPNLDVVALHLEYLRACMRDCLVTRNEAPFASHALYTQPGVLDDNKPEERAMGIAAGYLFWKAARRVAFYIDLGWSPGMLKAMNRLGNTHDRMGMEFEVRSLGMDWMARKQALLKEGPAYP